jgi:hypothetical protein
MDEIIYEIYAMPFEHTTDFFKLFTTVIGMEYNDFNKDMNHKR